MTLEEQIRVYKTIQKDIEELELKKKALSLDIMQQMQGKTVQVAEYMVRRYHRLSVKVSIEDARLMDAVKMEEVVDKDRIKALYQLDKSIQGVSEIQYICVSLLKES